jgi:hypothetical protein
MRRARTAAQRVLSRCPVFRACNRLLIMIFAAFVFRDVKRVQYSREKK